MQWKHPVDKAIVYSFVMFYSAFYQPVCMWKDRKLIGICQSEL